MIDSTNLVKIVNKYYNMQLLNKIPKQLDKQITFVLNSAWKYVKGPTRIVPFSLVKVKARVCYLYWKARVNQLKGRKIDIQVMEK